MIQAGNMGRPARNSKCGVSRRMKWVQEKKSDRQQRRKDERVLLEEKEAVLGRRDGDGCDNAESINT